MEDMVKSKKNDLTAIDSRCYGGYRQPWCQNALYARNAKCIMINYMKRI